MREAFLLSLRLHVRWFLEAFGERGRRTAPLGVRRLVFLLLIYPVFVLIQALHWLGFLLDEVFFRAYRAEEVRNPVFVTGIPRSGTTFVHRTLSADRQQFTTLRTWELLLAPSITGRTVMRAVAAVDRRLGSPLRRTTNWLTRRLAGPLADIHEVGLEAPEEDYLALLPVGGCFIMALAFPASQSLWQLARFQEMPDSQQEILLHFYYRCLQKHLYPLGGGRRILSKNAAFASWIPGLRQQFPDATFIICVREPLQALSSQLSSVHSGLRYFGTDRNRRHLRDCFEESFHSAYGTLRAVLRTAPDNTMVVIQQEKLRERPGMELRKALVQLQVPLSGQLEAILRAAEEESSGHTSNHDHSPEDWNLADGEFESCVRPLFEEIIKRNPVE